MFLETSSSHIAVSCVPVKIVSHQKVGIRIRDCTFFFCSLRYASTGFNSRFPITKPDNF
jgi:hypothetical protein